MSLDPYPTDAELRKIKKWPWGEGYVGLMDYVESLWMYGDWGWRRKGYSYRISTGGWSGNESLIHSMQQNFLFWSQCWVTSRTGGHYRFHIPKHVRKAKAAE